MTSETFGLNNVQVRTKEIGRNVHYVFESTVGRGPDMTLVHPPPTS